MNIDLSGQHAVVTGGASGLGLAVVEGYLAAGAKVSVIDLAPSANAALAALGVDYYSADVSDTARMRAVIDQCEAAAPIDILYNNAAIFDMAPLLESSEESFDRLFNINVRGMFFTLQAVAQKMVDRNASGRIINLASQAGRRGEALVSHYCASKAAVISYTQSAALALAPHGITVNAISPGVVDTPMWDSVDALFAKYENRPLGEKKTVVGTEVPLGRMGKPDDVAPLAVFLASDQARYITGQTYNVDGGNVLS